jgi:hypothetical protein
MANGKHARTRAVKATPKRQPDRLDDQEMSHLTGTAWRQCLREAHISVRQGARLIGVSKNTAQEYKLNGFVIPPLRSKKLAICFVKNLLLLLEIRNWRGA